ncbi:MAG: hypothetical protein KZQ94_10400 [Candidatus Thiodiazotropha sp. (ex Troendleina suluensis)]|nr:hypothetical protein [Candidatus Thiodiazotropha sp. (ex Troendleina suluensis)]
MAPIADEQLDELVHSVIAHIDRTQAPGWMKQTAMMLFAGLVSVGGTTGVIVTYEPESMQQIASASEFKGFKDSINSKLGEIDNQVNRLLGDQEKATSILAQLQTCQQNMNELKIRMNYFERFQRELDKLRGVK